MNDLLILLLAGGAIYYFWPQISGMLPATTSAAAATPVTAPGSPTSTVTGAPTSTTPASSVQPTAAASTIAVAASSPTAPTTTSPTSGVFTSPSTFVASATVGQEPWGQWTQPEIYSVLYTVTQPNTMMAPLAWSNLLEQHTGIVIPGDPTASAGMAPSVTIDTYWAWASQQLTALGVGMNGLRGLRGLGRIVPLRKPLAV